MAPIYGSNVLLRFGNWFKLIWNAKRCISIKYKYSWNISHTVFILLRNGKTKPSSGVHIQFKFLYRTVAIPAFRSFYPPTVHSCELNFVKEYNKNLWGFIFWIRYSRIISPSLQFSLYAGAAGFPIILEFNVWKSFKWQRNFQTLTDKSYSTTNQDISAEWRVQ